MEMGLRPHKLARSSRLGRADPPANLSCVWSDLPLPAQCEGSSCLRAFRAEGAERGEAGHKAGRDRLNRKYLSRCFQVGGGIYIWSSTYTKS
jgi:hypothetical protein